MSDLELIDLFRIEAENQSQVLTSGLLVLEREPTNAAQLESCMRAAHSIKGASRIVGLAPCVSMAHVLEDCFVAAQKGQITLHHGSIDLLLRGVDLLARIARTPEAEFPQWTGERRPEIDAFQAELAKVREGKEPAPHTDVQVPRAQDGPPPAAPPAAAAPAPAAPAPQPAPAAPAPAPAAREAAPAPAAAAATMEGDRVLRVTADNLNRLLGLTGESLVESRWLGPFTESLLRLKRRHNELRGALDALREALPRLRFNEEASQALADAQNRVLDCQQQLSQRLNELELFGRRSANLSHRLYGEALACRMRPFADGTRGFPRMVRDLAKSLGKKVRLDIVGETTQVDRDILEKLDAPLGHLLRNAIDHGIEMPSQRRDAGKSEEGRITLEARHSAAMLQISVSDDGRGVDLEHLKHVVIERGLSNETTVNAMTEAELLEFLFLPGFSTRKAVTEVSGRGVGLDVVRDMVKAVRGTVRVQTTLGKGTRMILQLPLTLSVVRTLLADAGGEPYAFPLAYIVRTLKLPVDRIDHLEGRPHFNFDGQHVGLVAAHRVLGGPEPRPVDGCWSVVVIGEKASTVGLIVDRFLGERELVVQGIDSRLGKVKDIATCALMADGSPVLIVDVEDLIRSVEKLAAAGTIGEVEVSEGGAVRRRKRVLVVDDSLTVRELERKLLGNRGYEVEIAVDGMDGWNAVRVGQFDLVISDIDMPRMDGIELVTLIRKDPKLKSLPVMVVSYKDREEDRRRGLEAGADYYLTKGSFHDETLLQAVVDLIGEVEKT